MTTTDECEGRTYRLPRNNQSFMLSFAECDDDHTAPRDDQQQYAEVEYGEYAEDGVYVAESEHSAYAERHVRS
jgi:hypothetical protein